MHCKQHQHGKCGRRAQRCCRLWRGTTTTTAVVRKDKNTKCILVPNKYKIRLCIFEDVSSWHVVSCIQFINKTHYCSFVYAHTAHTHAHIVHRTNITNAAQSSMWESFTLDFFHAFILCVGLLWYFTMLFVSFRSIPFVVSFCFWVNCHLHGQFWLQMCRHQQT